MVKATEFLLQPGRPIGGGSGGMLVVDGEKVAAVAPRAGETLPFDYGTLHLRVRQGAARILARATDAESKPGPTVLR